MSVPSATEVRDTLLAALGPAGANVLGTYALQSGATTPAVWLGTEVPTERRASGLELFVRKTPAISPVPLQDDGVEIHEAIEVRLTVHGSSSGFAEAVRRTVRKYPTATVGMVPPNERLEILEAAVITIR